MSVSKPYTIVLKFRPGRTIPLSRNTPYVIESLTTLDISPPLTRRRRARFTRRSFAHLLPILTSEQEETPIVIVDPP